MDKQGRKSMEVKEQLSHADESGVVESGVVETALDGVGYFMHGATDKMFSDSSPVAVEAGAVEVGYFMLGATDKMFSDSSPAPYEFVSDDSADALLASHPPVQEKVGQENGGQENGGQGKVGFVGERNGSLEVIRDGQRVALHEGDVILLKDIVITGDDSGAFLRFTSSKISHQTLRLDEEQRVVIEDFLAESLVAQLDAPNMNWQMSDGSLVLLPSNDDFATGYGAGYGVDSARARLLQADKSGGDKSGADKSEGDKSGGDKSDADSLSSRASEYLAGGASELDYYAYSQPQDFSQGNLPITTLQGDNLQGGNLQESARDLTAEASSDPALSEVSSDLSSQGVQAGLLSELTSEFSGEFSGQNSPPNYFDPSVPTAEEFARLAQEQARAEQAAEDQARADAEQAAEDQARADAEQAAEEQARADAEQVAEDQARADAEQVAEEQARADAEQVAEDQARADAEQAAEDQARADAEQAAEEQARADAEQVAEDQARADAEQAAEEQAAEESGSSKDDGEAELEHFLLDNDADWSFDMTQTSAEPWDFQPQQSSPEPLKSEPLKSEPLKSEPLKSEPLKSEPLGSGYSLYEQDAAGDAFVGAGEISGL